MTNVAYSHSSGPKHRHQQHHSDSMHSTLQLLITLISDSQRKEYDREQMQYNQLLQRLDQIERNVAATLAAQRLAERRLAQLDKVLEEREFTRDHNFRTTVQLAHSMSSMENSITQANHRLDETVRGQRTLLEKLVTIDRSLEKMTRSEAYGQQRMATGIVDRLVERGTSAIVDAISSANATLAATLASHRKQLDLEVSHSHQQQQTSYQIQPGGQSPRPRTLTTTGEGNEGNVDGAGASQPKIPTVCNHTSVSNIVPSSLAYEALLNQSMLSFNASFNKLDDDIEIYTRKVLNNVQELTRSTQDVESIANVAQTIANSTFYAMASGFDDINDRLVTLRDVDYSVTQLRDDLHSKYTELTSQIQTDYSTLLAAQNEFIKSCNRVQHSEATFYYEVENMMDELLNSSNDNQKLINTTISRHNGFVHERLDKIYGLLVKVVKRLKQEGTFEEPGGGNGHTGGVSSVGAGVAEHSSHNSHNHQQHCQLTTRSLRDLANEVARQLNEQRNQQHRQSSPKLNQVPDT